MDKKKCDLVFGILATVIFVVGLILEIVTRCIFPWVTVWGVITGFMWFCNFKNYKKRW